MLAKMIDKILDIAQPLTVKVNGETWTAKNLQRVDYELRAEPIEGKTLTGLIDFVKAYAGKFDGWKMYFIHVEDEKTVAIKSDLDNDRKRETIMRVIAKTPILPVGTYCGNENFLIGMQAAFIPDDDTDFQSVIKFAAATQEGSIKEYVDNGISQSATIKTKVSGLQDAIAPSPAYLRPYRTFMEIEQPQSAFVFRMKAGNPGEGPQCALFEADGGAWKNEAMESIREFLVAELAAAGIEMPVIA